MSAPASTGAAVHTRIEGDVLVLTIDNPPVNALSAPVRQGLQAGLERARQDSAITAVVLTGAGKTFIGGADIREFGQPPAEPLLPDVIGQIEDFPKPVIAAINGAALGGGLEVALACHYRIATTGAKLALPEVKLGLVPGAGGTQRLPRLIGLETASGLIASGRTIIAAEGLEAGVIDALAVDDLLAGAIDGAGDRPLRRTGMIAIAAYDEAALEAASAKTVAKARGQKAPGEALRLVRLAATLPLAEGLAEERATFLRLRDSDEARALRHVFLAERAASKIEGLEGVAPRPVGTVGICGMGLMGAGIATAILSAGYHVIGLEQTDEAAGKGRERIIALLERAVKSGRLDHSGQQAQLARLSVTADDAALAPCDLVIEAVFDDFDIKEALLARLENVLREGAVIATNTSYLDPDALGATMRKPERLLGLHFFSPANIMRLVEVVRCAQTAPDVLATGLDVARKIGKLPVVSGVCEGFIGNRIFSAYRREAEFLLEDGALPHEIDAALESYGFPMGLFAVNDMAGLEIAWARRKRQAATRDPSERYVAIADRLCEAGRLGQKAGKGWYLWHDGKRDTDPEVTTIIAQEREKKGMVPRHFTAEEIQERMIAAMRREGEALLAEGIAARASDIDVVMINGYGFPAARGGPMFR